MRLCVCGRGERLCESACEKQRTRDGHTRKREEQREEQREREREGDREKRENSKRGWADTQKGRRNAPPRCAPRPPPCKAKHVGQNQCAGQVCRASVCGECVGPVCGARV